MFQQKMNPTAPSFIPANKKKCTLCNGSGWTPKYQIPDPRWRRKCAHCNDDQAANFPIDQYNHQTKQLETSYYCKKCRNYLVTK